MYSLLGAIVTSSLIYVCKDEIEIAERGMWRGNVLHPFLMTEYRVESTEHGYGYEVCIRIRRQAFFIHGGPRSDFIGHKPLGQSATSVCID